MAKTEFEKKIYDDVQKQKGTSFTVKASLLERLLVRKTACSNLHPNAEDEFTFENVGPSMRIIGEYEEKFRYNQRHNQPIFDDALIVEKLHPKGYLLLNGHHRWAAAMRCQIKKVPIKIVNLAQDSDIKKILENSKHDKRVTLDLDEVIFRSDNDKYVEAVPKFRLIKFKKKLKLGVPALFHYLSKHGYDIWVYSAQYYSIDDIQRFFRAYSVHVDGIITGTEKRKASNAASAVQREKMIAAKYKQTLHIDNDMVLMTGDVEGAKYKKYDLSVPADEWSRKAIDIIGEIVKDGNKA
ncbi:MAG: ParB-like nuclease domain-containing protein [Clostridiales bacterium]|nr:ParB-like nuclease domain-containing protein [Clostridiales bacterium]